MEVVLGIVVTCLLGLLLVVVIGYGLISTAAAAVKRTAGFRVERVDGRLNFTGTIVATEDVAKVATEFEVVKALDETERAKRALKAAPRFGGDTSSVTQIKEE